MPTKKSEDNLPIYLSSVSDDWLIKNAISCWLYHFGDQQHEWESRYRELVKRDSYIPRPRPAKRSQSRNRNDSTIKGKTE